MATYTFSATRKRGKVAAVLVSAAIILGIVLAALVVGVLVGIDPAISVRIFIVLTMPLALALVWAAPKSVGDPAGRLNQLLICLALASVFWPPYITFSAGGLPSMEPRRFVLLVMLGVWLYKMFTSPVLAQRFFSR